MIRALGVDDGFFPERRGTVPLFCVLMRGTLMEGALYSRITVDGDDVTEVLIDLIRSSRFASQPRVIFTSGTTFAGTNVLDLPFLYAQTGIPVIAVIRRPPGPKFERAVDHSPHPERVRRILDNNPPFLLLRTKRGTVYVASSGLDPEGVKRLVEDYQIYSLLPEPVRVAHIVASAIGLGESRGRP